MFFPYVYIIKKKFQSYSEVKRFSQFLLRYVDKFADRVFNLLRSVVEKENIKITGVYPGCFSGFLK